MQLFYFEIITLFVIIILLPATLILFDFSCEFTLNLIQGTLVLSELH